MKQKFESVVEILEEDLVNEVIGEEDVQTESERLMVAFGENDQAFDRLSVFSAEYSESTIHITHPNQSLLPPQKQKSFLEKTGELFDNFMAKPSTDIIKLNYDASSSSDECA